jgi:hypothetical protein
MLLSTSPLAYDRTYLPISISGSIPDVFVPNGKHDLATRHIASSHKITRMGFSAKEASQPAAALSTCSIQSRSTSSRSPVSLPPFRVYYSLSVRNVTIMYQYTTSFLVIHFLCFPSHRFHISLVPASACTLLKCPSKIPKCSVCVYHGSYLSASHAFAQAPSLTCFCSK